MMTTLVYDERGELPALSVSYTADSYLSGGAAALELARAINDADLGYYAGQRDGEAFVPAVGQNRIYSDSEVTNVEVRVDYAPEPEFVYAATLSAESLVEINDMGMTDVHFSVSVNANSTVTATLYDAAGNTVTGDEWSIGGQADLKLHVHEASAGQLSLVVIANSLDTNGTKQLSTTVTVEDNRVSEDPVTETDEDSTQGGGGDNPTSCEITDPMSTLHAPYAASTTYSGGELVSYNGLVYQAKWWTRGNAPDATDAFELISDVILEYSDSTVYEGGDRARYQGNIYEAKWWTRGTAPSNRDPWKLIGEANCG